MDLSSLSLAALRRRFVDGGQSLSAEEEAALEAEPRAGARAVLAAVRRRRQENRAEGQRLRHLLRFETDLWERGVVHVAGVDEAGMGTLAGPVVAAAAILPHDFRPRGLDDSKKLDEKERDRLAAEVKAGAVAWALGSASPGEIDKLNIYRAGLLAMRRAVEALSCRPEQLLVDARRIPELRIPQQGIVKGDAKSLSIAAASVLAKTARDALMVEMDAAHPGYGFAKHKGYSAPEHVEALRRLGPCPTHRRTFAPVREALAGGPAQRTLW
ncbi:MAG: ribonuclease HII [Deltaproteobacteria bacterium]|nr:ribonuclease HII [Deltaproteobacteria bacterium]